MKVSKYIYEIALGLYFMPLLLEMSFLAMRQSNNVSTRGIIIYV